MAELRILRRLQGLFGMSRCRQSSASNGIETVRLVYLRRNAHIYELRHGHGGLLRLHRLSMAPWTRRKLLSVRPLSLVFLRRTLLSTSVLVSGMPGRISGRPSALGSAWVLVANHLSQDRAV